MTSDEEVRIVSGTADDLPVVLSLIRKLAEYEKLGHEVSATEDKLRASLFGRQPAAEVLIAYAGTEPIGFAVYFQNFSTFVGGPGIYLEDLYVVPEWRRRGCGRRPLADVARTASQL